MNAPKTERFEFRLTEQEDAALKKLAKKQGVSVSNLVRMLIRRSAQRQKVWL